MAYRYAARTDHSDLAAGRVLRSAPGYPGFPVRLADELFQRALGHLAGRLRVWDPCCGSGHLAAVLGLLHRERIAHLRAGDASAEAAELAERNLSLLTKEGMAARAAESRQRAAEFAKPSYGETAEAADRLGRRLAAGGGDLPYVVERADAFRPAVPEPPADLVVTDVPYGRLTEWSGAVPEDGDPVPVLLGALAAVLPGHAVLVLTARVRKVAVPEGARVLERVRAGGRSAVLLRAAELH